MKTLGKIRTLVWHLLQKISIFAYFVNSPHLMKIEKDGKVFKATYMGKKWFIPIKSRNLARWALNCMQVNERYLDTLREGDIVVEVGGCTGEYTVPAAQKIGEHGKIFTFEADPLGCECIKKNAELYSLKNIEVINEAVSDIVGQWVKLSIPKNLSGGVLVGDDKGSMKTTTLDAYLSDVRAVVLKITVNGSEPEVLMGARELLKNVRSVVFQSARYEEIIQILEDYCFTVKKLEDAHYSPENVKTGLLERC
jgi:FkbM family methyltransferase